MRDLVFKNLTSTDKRRKVIASSEITDKAGVRSTIHRHFVCVVREIDQGPVNRPKPYLYVLKVRNNKEQKEKFFCRIKGVIFAINNSKLYEILFMHSLKICLIPAPPDQSLEPR